MSERRSLRAEKKAARLKARRKRRMKRITVLVAELLILSILGGVIYVMAKYDKFQTISFGVNDIQSNPGIKLDGYTTVALFGGDSREGTLGAGAHADTIIIASINGKTKDIRMASVYRDTIVEQADGEMWKANYAYFVGGPKDAINMLNKNFDLDIQDYVTVDFKAVADAIDLLGGIEVDVTEAEMKEMNRYIGETGRVADKKANQITKSGMQTLDGVQAVTYARIRKNVGGDFKRAERQRIVIDKVVKKAKTMKLSTVNRIVDKVFPQISTSFSLREMIGLASAVFEYKLDGTTGFPMESMTPKIQGIGSVVVPVGMKENVEELHEFLYPDEIYAGPSDTVREISDKVESLTGITRENLETSKAEIFWSGYKDEQTSKQLEEE